MWFLHSSDRRYGPALPHKLRPDARIDQRLKMPLGPRYRHFECAGTVPPKRTPNFLDVQKKKVKGIQVW
jgi:hypothetical protein